MIRPSKAIILAAGLGERMRPLSAHMPKAMMPFAGKPIIDHTIATLTSWGVTDILINLHHAPSPLVEHLRAKEFAGVHVAFSFEPDIRGTGGALRQADWFMDKKPFWIINSDIILEIDPAPICDEFERRKPLACLWMTSTAGPRTVDVNDGAITCFSSRTPGTDCTATFCGLHLVSPRIMKYIPDSTFSSIVTAYISALKDRKKIRAVELPGSFWADIGSPEKLLDCHIQLAARPACRLMLHAELAAHLKASRRILSAQGVKASGMVSVGDRVTVSRSASLENCILGCNVSIGPNSTVSRCVVGSDASITGSVSRAAVALPAAFDVQDIAALEGRAGITRRVVAEALPPRGSDRALYRLHGAKQPVILIKYDARARPENARFTQNLQFLSTLGVPVPNLLLDLPDRNITIVEDLGNVSMQDACGMMPPHIRNELFSRIIRFTAMLHSKGADLSRARNMRFEPPFTAKLYKWEHDLFAEHYLSGMLDLDKRTIDLILKELQSIPALLKEPRVLIHRDLQSSNIMLQAGRPVLIDFQGMRLGSRYYDLASLLLDPYVCLPRELRAALIKEYASLNGLDEGRTAELTHIAGIQRLAQALGAYGRLSKLEGMAHFTDYIKPARHLMSSCMAYTLKLPVLADIIAES